MFALLFSFLLFASLLAAQTRRPAAKTAPRTGFKLAAIKVIGAKRYSPADVIAATGLAVGQAAIEDDFKRVTRRLGETGAFSAVSYTYQYSGEGAKLELQVSENDQFVPAHFDNFVWLSDAELLAKLHELTPLFHGELPLTGDLADQIQEDLQAMLSQRNVPGHVSYLREGPEGGPVEAFAFNVADITIQIRNVSFPGAGEAELPALQAAADRAQGEEYSRATLRVLTEKNLLPVYLARGYLKASVGDAQAKVVQQGAERTDVDISFAVVPGRQYRVAEVQLPESKVIAPAELRDLIRVKPGKPADAMRLARDVEAIKRLYGTHGYMAADVQSVPTLDEAAGTVSYRLKIQEGDQYHMGELDIRGLDSRVTARLQAAWKLHEGDPYDASYLERFVDEAKGTLAGDWDVDAHQTPDAKDKTVDVTLRFDRRS